VHGVLDGGVGVGQIPPKNRGFIKKDFSAIVESVLDLLKDQGSSPQVNFFVWV